jgi:uncharacterized protein YggU (UPF0235/DUF167 family)
LASNYGKIEFMYIKVEVNPGAKKERLEKLDEDSFFIAVREKAERNLANRKILSLLAIYLGLPVNKLRIISGHRSRHKIISVSIDNLVK